MTVGQPPNNGMWRTTLRAAATRSAILAGRPLSHVFRILVLPHCRGGVPLLRDLRMRPNLDCGAEQHLGTRLDRSLAPYLRQRAIQVVGAVTQYLLPLLVPWSVRHRRVQFLR